MPRPARDSGGRRAPTGSALAGALAGVLALLAVPPARAAPDPPDPIAAAAQPVVLFFVAPDCPISDRYAPEILRLRDRVRAEGGTALIVYAGDVPADEARRHAGRVGFGDDVRLDPGARLARRALVEVTPEAAVFRDGRLIYSGRIDDRVVRFGVVRPAPTRRDLAEAVARARAGRDLAFRRVPGVGCALPVRP